MILYFSGTGNSEYVARRIGEVTGDEILSINDRIKRKSGKGIASAQPLVFVTPTYSWRIPRLVEEWIEKISFTGNQKAYFVMTCGSDNGNAGKYVEKLCQKKNFEYMGCVSIVMPENYVAMFPVPEEKEAISIVQQAKPEIEEIGVQIKSGIRLEEKQIALKDHITSGLIPYVFYPFFVKDRKFHTTDACIGCGKCEKVCPLNNVKLKDKKPVWNGKCTHCMACICGCPTHAIEYGRASVGKPRYHCPMS